MLATNQTAHDATASPQAKLVACEPETPNSGEILPVAQAPAHSLPTVPEKSFETQAKMQATQQAQVPTSTNLAEITANSALPASAATASSDLTARASDAAATLGPGADLADAKASQNHEAEKSNFGLFLAIFPATLVSQIILMSVGVINAIMAAKISVTAMASLALAGSIIWPLNALGTGLLSVQLSKMGYALGRKKYQLVGAIHRQSYWLIAGVSGLIMLILGLFAFNLDLVHMDPEMQAIVKPYLLLSLINVPLFQLIVAFRNLNSAIAYTLPTLYTSIIGLVCIIPLNWLFMYGHAFGGEPRAELAALAQIVLTLLYLAVIIVLIVCNPAKYGKFKLFTPIFSRPDVPLIIDTCKIGLPIAIQSWLENSFYGIVAVLLAHLGTIVVAAHETGMITYGAVFTVSVSSAASLTSIASRRLGQHDRKSAQSVLYAILAANLVINILVGFVIVALRDDIAMRLTNGNAQAAVLASHVLIFLAFSNVFDGLYCTILGYLVPYRDSRFAVLIALFVTWFIFMPLACLLAFTDTFAFVGLSHLGIYAFWSVFILIGITCFSIFALRCWKRWHAMPEQQLWNHLSKMAAQS